MKVTCRFSGVTYEVQNFGNTYLPQSAHPLMGNDINLSTLEALFKTWSIGQLRTDESRILFVAYMRYSEFFDFRTTASPSPAIVEINMQRLRDLCNYKDVISNPRLVFPSYAIDTYSRNCAAIGGFLETCHDRIKSWKDNFKNDKLRQRLDDIEEKLSKSLKSAYNNPEQAMTQLARWTMIAADVPKQWWEYWMPIFKTKGLDIFKLNTIYLDNLMDHLDEHLASNFSSHSALFASEALRVIRGIHETHHRGIEKFIGIDIDELAGFDFEAMRANPYKLIDDDTETKNMMSIAQIAPITEPKKNDYEKLFDYLKAKAQWNIAVLQYNRAIMELRATKEFEDKQKKELNEDALDNTESVEDEIDPRQFGIEFPNEDGEENV